MRIHLNSMIKKSHHIRTLMAFTLGAGIFSCSLFFPDIFKFQESKYIHEETMAHEITHILLSALLAIVSFFSIRGFQIQKKLLSVIETLPHSILMFDRMGKMITANKLGREILKDLDCPKNIAYTKFIESICKYNIQNSQKQDGEDLTILNAFESQRTLFQDTIFSPHGKIYVLQCQETRTGEKIILITETTKLHHLNHEARTLLSAIDLSPAGYALAHIGENDFDIFYSNNAYRDLLEIRHGTGSLSHHLRSLLNETEWKKLLNTISQNEPYSFETTSEDQSGKNRWLSGQIFPFIQNSQNMILICMNDRTEQKMKDSQSQQSARLETMGHLAGGIAHDFNNILSIIQGYLKLSLKDTTNDDQLKDYNKQMQKAVARGSSLTKQLLSFGRNQISSTGHTALIPHMQDMEGFMATLIHSSARMQFSMPSNHDLKIDCPPDIFTQIIMNLAVNARDAMPQGGNIMIAAHVISDAERDQLPTHLKQNQNDYICIQVSDTGTGIDPDHLPHIFDPFFTTKEAGKGTGLGLSLIYRHIEKLNGHINVISTQNEGTTFSVFLPLCDRCHEMDTMQKPLPIQTHHDLTGKIVLLAEDEPDLRMILKSTLEEWNCIVYDAGDGAEALSKQDALPHVDFLITDVMMPTMNGLRLAEIMRDLHPACRTIFISGYPKGGDLAMVKIPEHSLFLTKPIDEDVLKKIMLSNQANTNASTWAIQQQTKGDNYGEQRL